MEFYGTQNETVVKTEKGNIYLIQSPDMAGEYEMLTSIPAGFEELSPALCYDLKIPQDILNEEIQYWQHDKSGETYAVLPNQEQCFGPLHHSDIGKITTEDERWDTEDWEWVNTEPCHLRED